jgi:hypothetical protein
MQDCAKTDAETAFGAPAEPDSPIRNLLDLGYGSFLLARAYTYGEFD